jgi:hypothetical protein
MIIIIKFSNTTIHYVILKINLFSQNFDAKFPSTKILSTILHFMHFHTLIKPQPLSKNFSQVPSLTLTLSLPVSWFSPSGEGGAAPPPLLLLHLIPDRISRPSPLDRWTPSLPYHLHNTKPSPLTLPLTRTPLTTPQCRQKSKDEKEKKREGGEFPIGVRDWW